MTEKPLQRVSTPPHSFDQSDEDPVATVGDYVDDEIGHEWQRKSSFETRSFALVTANLALVTLFITLVTQLNLRARLDSPATQTLLYLALAFNIVSTLVSIVSAMPRNYPTTEIDAIEAVFADAKNSSSNTMILQEIVDVKIGQLQAAQASNDGRARYAVASYVILGIATALLVASIIVSVTINI